MIDPQTAIDALMTLLLNGGPDAAKSLFKGMVVNGAKSVSDTWQEIFSHQPESYPLADRVAQQSEDSAEMNKLRVLLEEVFAQRPELLAQLHQTVTIGDIKADKGSVAVGVAKDSLITITNK